MSLNSLYHANTKGGKNSHLVITSDSDNTFSDTPTVTLVDNQAGAPKLTVKSTKAFRKNRYLLIRYIVERIVQGTPGSTPVESGLVTISITNAGTSSTMTTAVGVAYTDDSET